MEYMQLCGIHSKKKPIFPRLFSIFKYDNTVEDTAGQSWLYYKGPKREIPRLFSTTECMLFFHCRWCGLESPLLCITTIELLLCFQVNPVTIMCSEVLVYSNSITYRAVGT